ncbi:hypothetical protein TD95_004390 [Thielaviopsis punctulata]|uniref:Uncharacterized protein n=1 Tax=Thielaviopsis punctulata TaxID=72032 RepID=A0A0F4ZIB9_9PEZI|nr:hypothetical protein TD95_004390 [Thielaviopsis punctulata]
MSNNTFPLAGQGSDSGSGIIDGTEVGASGDSSGNSGISSGGMIAIIIVVAAAAIIGAIGACLFFVAKKREWKVRESIRRSARRVAAALTPRRTEFPKSVKQGKPPKAYRNNYSDDHLEDIPPTPRLKPEDLEKGLQEVKSKRKNMRWGR